MIVTYTLDRNTPLTPEQIAQLDALKDRPIVYDEDSPRMTPEMYQAFKRSVVERNRRQLLEREAAEKEQNVS